MSELAELDERVTNLEREMADVRKLASGASSEAGDVHVRLLAHTRSLEALRQTQIEQGKEIRDLRSEMRDGFREMRQGFARLDGRIGGLEGEMRQGFATVGVGMAQITALLNIAIGKPEEEPDQS